MGGSCLVLRWWQRLCLVSIDYVLGDHVLFRVVGGRTWKPFRRTCHCRLPRAAASGSASLAPGVRVWRQIINFPQPNGQRKDEKGGHRKDQKGSQRKDEKYRRALSGNAGGGQMQMCSPHTNPSKNFKSEGSGKGIPDAPAVPSARKLLPEHLPLELRAKQSPRLTESV